MGFATVPAENVQAQILQFNVPSGYYFYLAQVGLFFSGANFNFGDFIFTVDLNTPLGGGIYQSVPLESTGSRFPSPWETSAMDPSHCPAADLFSPEDQIRAKVTNINLGGGGGSFGAWLGGWIIPASEIPYAE